MLRKVGVSVLEDGRVRTVSFVNMEDIDSLYLIGSYLMLLVIIAVLMWLLHKEGESGVQVHSQCCANKNDHL